MPRSRFRTMSIAAPWLWVAAVLSLCSVVDAGHRDRLPRIGYLLLSPLTEPPSPERGAFVGRLAELGYVDGETVRFFYRSAQWDRQALDGLALELVGLDVDVIVTVTSAAALAAKRATETIPIVFSPASDPIADGLVASLVHPGANITGFSLYAPELGAKRLALLKEAFPHIERVGLLWNAANPNLVAQRRATERQGSLLGIEIVSYPVDTAEDWTGALGRMTEGLPDALIVIADSRTMSYRRIIAEFGLRHRLPTIYGLRRCVEAGGLMSYGPNLPRVFRHIAGVVDRILRGVRPGQLPVQQPMNFELVINMETAKALGRSIASSILVRADEVVE